MPGLRVATYNVHGCVGIDRQRSEKRIAEVIASMQVDLVGLQELDLGRARSAGVDQAQAIAAELGWQFLFEPAMRRAEEQYGNAVISRFPLTHARSIELPGCGTWYCREQRVALWAEVETEIGRVQTINTHFGLGLSERLLQAQALVKTEHLGAAPTDEPLLLMGDFNSRPGSRIHQIFASTLREARALLPSPHPRRTYPTRWPTLAVDHIFTNAALHPVSLEVHRTALACVASDHFPLVGEFVRHLSAPERRA